MSPSWTNEFRWYRAVPTARRRDLATDQMVAWEQAQMVVDLPADGMLESGQEAESDQQRASPVRQHPRARSGGRPDEHADRPDGARIGVIPPAPPLHENLNPVIHSTRRISILW